MLNIRGSRGALRSCRAIKLLERILYGRIRKSGEVEIGEEQQWFRKGRRRMDVMFTLSQLVEKSLEVQDEMALGFVNLEKADDTVLRDGNGDTEKW